MIRFLFILAKIFRSKNNSLSLLSSISIVIAISLSIVFVSLILSISNGFKSNIINIITDIEGYATIYPALDDFNSSSPYIYSKESFCLIQNKYYAERVKLINTSSNNLIDKYIVESSDDDGVFIGHNLYNKMNLEVGDNIILKNSTLLNNSDPIIMKVKGSFKTDFPYFDKHLIFLNDSDYYSKSNVIPKIIFLSEPSQDIQYDNIIYWNELYADLNKWLKNYEKPIYFLFILILSIVIINNASCYNIDIINRYKEIHLYRKLGLDLSSIKRIFIIKFLILNIVGFLLGIIVSLLIMKAELYYHFIKIPADIYYTDILLLKPEFSFFAYPVLMIFTGTLILGLLSNYFYIKKIYSHE